jgi:hypothetical protein
MDQFLAALDRLPIGYSEGRYAGHRWSVTLDMAADRRRCWLWGEQLGGTGRVSFNLYRLADGPLLSVRDAGRNGDRVRAGVPARSGSHHATAASGRSIRFGAPTDF